MRKFIISKEESIEIYGTESNNIGNGTCSAVYKTDKSIAVKVYIAEICTQIPEVAILKKLTHQNILKPLCINLANEEYITKSYDFDWIQEHTIDSHTSKWIHKPDSRYGIKMYMPLANMTLDAIPKEKFKNIAFRKNIYKQLLEAVAYCHEHDVWHTDIKPSNILIFNSPDVNNPINIKLADFSASLSYARVSNANTFNIQTLYYRSPEIILNYRLYDERIDIWSIGVIMWQYLPHSDPILNDMFVCASRDTLLDIIVTEIGYPTKWLDGVSKLDMDFKKLEKYDSTMKKQQLSDKSENYDKDEAHLISRLLEWPHKRYSAKKALAHSYFSDVHVDPSNTGTYASTVVGMSVEMDVDKCFECIKLKRKEAIIKLHQEMDNNLRYSTRFHTYVLFDLFIVVCKNNDIRIPEDQIPAYLFACMLISSHLFEQLLYIEIDDRRNPTDKYTTAKYINHILEVMDFDIIFDTAWLIIQKIETNHVKMNRILLDIITEEIQTLENQKDIAEKVLLCLNKSEN